MGVSKRSVALAKPCFAKEEEQALLEVIRSGWVTQGPKVAEFEERFAAAVGIDNAVAVSSATTALSLALHVLGIGAGDEVVVPSLTFIASVNPIVHSGATPVFADVDPRSFNLDPDAFEAALTPRTRAVMLIHQLGLPADLDEIQRRADAHGVAILEDSACALGSSHKGQPIGSSRNLNCFSFHPRKVIVTGEGGMMTTPDAALAARLRRLRHQGMSISDAERHKADRVITETYPEIGFNYRMSDLHAAVGIAQLDKLGAFVARRRAIAARYDEAFAEHPDIVTPYVPDFAVPNYQSYIARLNRGDHGVRDALLDAMFHRGVATRRGLMAVHKEASYADVPTTGSLAHTDAADAQSFVLPIYADLSDDDQEYVIDSLRESVSEVMPA